MYCRHWSIVGLLVTTLTSACAMQPTARDIAEDREAALLRWDRCIDRETTRLDAVDQLDVGTVIRLCDGHKRDVLATWPRHASDDLDALLLQRTRERVGARVAENAVDAIIRQAAFDGDD